MAVLRKASFRGVNRRADGFTLVELLVVLTILGMLAGLAIPHLFGVIRRSRLQQSARQFVDDLGTARLLAVNHGIPYQLRYERHGSHYTIEPLGGSERDGVVESDLVNGLSDGARVSLPPSGAAEFVNRTFMTDGGANGGPNGGGSSARPVLESIANELTIGVQFGHRPSVTTQSPVPQPAGDYSNELPISEGSLDSLQAAGASWVNSVVFYPDGRADKYVFELRADDGRWVQLTVRGITGSVTIGPVMRSPAAVANPVHDQEVPADALED